MFPPRPRDGARVVVLCGAGLSAASGIPAFRDENGLWEGRRIDEIASPAAWWRDRETVRRFYDVRRINLVHVMPNAGHEALARLQHRWGAPRVVLATTAMDGLLTKAGSADVIEMNGCVFGLQCEEDDDHPHVQVYGAQNRNRQCAACGASLRPDVVWHGEPIRHVDRVVEALRACEYYLAVGSAADDPHDAAFVDAARAVGARCIEINPNPTGLPFDEVVAEPAEEAVPRLVGRWLGETA